MRVVRLLQKTDYLAADVLSSQSPLLIATSEARCVMFGKRGCPWMQTHRIQHRVHRNQTQSTLFTPYWSYYRKKVHVSNPLCLRVDVVGPSLLSSLVGRPLCIVDVSTEEVQPTPAALTVLAKTTEHPRWVYPVDGRIHSRVAIGRSTIQPPGTQPRLLHTPPEHPSGTVRPNASMVQATRWKRLHKFWCLCSYLREPSFDTSGPIGEERSAYQIFHIDHIHFGNHNNVSHHSLQLLRKTSTIEDSPVWCS